MKNVVGVVVGILAAARSAAGEESFEIDIGAGQTRKFFPVEAPKTPPPSNAVKHCKVQHGVVFRNIFIDDIRYLPDYDTMKDVGKIDIGAAAGTEPITLIDAPPATTTAGQCERACMNEGNCDVFECKSGGGKGCECALIQLGGPSSRRLVRKKNFANDAMGDCRHWTTDSPTSAPTPPPTDSGSRVPTSSMLLGLAGSLTATAVTIAVD